MFKNTKHGPDGSIDLFEDALATGEPVSLEREQPNGRFAERDTPSTDFGVDRGQGGQFVSRDRAPAPQVRHDDGELASDAYGVGNFGAFEGGRFGGDRR